ncbi:MAG: S8 family serine peptidase [Fibrobacterales bacterium]
MTIKTKIGKALSVPLIVALGALNATSAQAMEFSPSDLTFGLTPNDSPADQTAVLTNTTNNPVNYSIKSAGIIARPFAASNQTSSFTQAAAQATQSSIENIDSAPYVEGQIIISLKEVMSAKGSSKGMAHRALARLNVKKLKNITPPKFAGLNLAFSSQDQLLVVTLEDKSHQNVINTINNLKNDQDVNFVEPDWIVQSNRTPNDPELSRLWGMEAISASEAWDSETGRNEVVIGVVDSGIDYLHPALQSNIWTNVNEVPGNGIDDDGNGYIDDIHGYDFVNDDSDPMDDDGHGTHCAGTIAGSGDDGHDIVGVMWNARLMALKFLDNTGHGPTSAAIEAINYANAMGVSITNNSWGGSQYSQALHDAIDAGGLFVAAAGNNGQLNNDLNAHYPSNYSLNNIIAVAATDINDNIAGFSHYGAVSVDVAAPGVGIYSSLPNNRYASANGTSMAAPHVAGLAGLIYSLNSQLSSTEIKETIMSTVDPVAGLAGLMVTGGRINASRAISATTPSWLQVSDNGTGILNPGESVNFSVTVDPTYLAEGTWSANLIIGQSANPAQDVVLPITVNVGPCRALSASVNSVVYPIAWIGDSETEEITLTNSCNAEVTINSITTSDAAFGSLLAAPAVVSPFSTVTVPVVFSPLDEVVYNSVLTIVSDAEDNETIIVTLDAEGQFGPQIIHNPTAINETLAANTAKTINLTFSNPGVRDLIFTLNTDAGDSWIDVSTAEITIASGQSQDVSVMVVVPNLGGTVTSEIFINHNAVGATPIIIPVSVTTLADNYLSVNQLSIDWGIVSNRTHPTFDIKDKATKEGGSITSVHSTDIDLDGDLDFIYGYSFSNRNYQSDLIISENTADCYGQYTEHTIYSGTEAQLDYYEIESGDIDGDGDIDLFVGMGNRGSGAKLFWFENDGTQNFTRHELIFDGYPHKLSVVDYDHDGDSDLLVVNSTDDEFVFYENDGSQSFTIRSWSTDDTEDVMNMNIVDFNKDGLVDFVGTSRNIIDESKKSILWYENLGNHTFQKRVILYTPYSLYLSVGDIDSDNDFDLLATTWSDGAFWIENDNGLYKMHLLDIEQSTDHYIVDMDNDGDKDIALTMDNGSGTRSISILENDGNETFTAEEIYPSSVIHFIATDVNNDGDIDLFFNNYVDKQVTIMNNELKLTQSIQLENSGGNATTISSLEIDNSLFTINYAAPVEIAPQTSVCFELVYNATGTQKETATLSIQSDAMDNSSISVALEAGGEQTAYDVALNKSASASSTESGLLTDNAIDGDNTTRWSSDFADPQWFIVDLEGSFDISEVILTWETAAAKVYSIDVSNNNGQNWTTVYTDNNGNGGVDHISVSEDNVTHVKMYGTQRTTQWGYSLFSFEVMGVPHRTEPPVVTTLDVTPLQATIFEYETQQFTAQAYDQFGNPMNASISWSTLGGMIGPTGLFTGTEIGSFTVAANANGVIATASITVNEAPVVDRITLTPANTTLNIGQTQQYTAVAYDQYNAVISAVFTWNVNGTSGTLTQNGLFTAISAHAGDVITVTSGAQSATASVIVVDAPPSDIALGKPASASSDEVGYSASNAVDGNGTTRWSSDFSDPQWIEIDLQGSFDISRVVLAWETAAASEYQVQVLVNDRWSTIHITTNGNGGTDEHIVNASNATKIRMYGTKRTTEWGYSLFSFEVYGVPHISEPPVLTSIEVTDMTVALESITRITFQGYDQFNNPMNIQGMPDYSVSGGGWVRDGYFTAEEAGNWSVTVSADGVSGVGSITVEDSQPLVLTTIEVTDMTVALGSITRIEFQGYDQFNNPMSIQGMPDYSVSGGGWIRDGYFTAEEAGNWSATVTADGISGVGTITVEDLTNLISNGGFDNNVEGWTLDTYGSANGFLQHVNNECIINMGSGGSENWHVQFRQNGIPLEAGKTYRLSFDARANANRSIDAQLETDGNPWTNYGNIPATAITTTLSNYEYTFTMNETDMNARIVFNIGNNSNNVYLDNITVVEIP